MAMSTTPYLSQSTTVYCYYWDSGDNYADAITGHHEHTVLSPASGSGRWHVCWDEPTAPEGLNSRALRHLRKTGRRMSWRNYKQACKAVGVAQ